MREILKLCVSLDRTAFETYRGLATECETRHPELATIFSQMAKEERRHVDWWSDLLVAWESGLVPDIADEHELLARLQEVEAEVDQAIPEFFRELSIDEMLDLAAHLEFYMLDPAFGELTDLMQPGNKAEVRKSYEIHVMRLVESIEAYHTKAGLASFLARVLKRTFRDQQRLASLATRDQLTGLYNRRGLFGHLAQWLSWSARYGRPLSVALIDVDNFKRINDTLGHASGDDALRAVAGALESAVRTSDVVGRFGGDEFLVIAPETDEAELARLMDRVNITVREAPLMAGTEPLFLSVSVGGAWTPGGFAVEAETLIAAADRSLYEAKEGGRDRAGAPMLSGPAAYA